MSDAPIAKIVRRIFCWKRRITRSSTQVGKEHSSCFSEVNMCIRAIGSSACARNINGTGLSPTPTRTCSCPLTRQARRAGSTLPVLFDEHMVKRALHYLTFPLCPWKPHFSLVIFQYFSDPLATPRSLGVSMNQDLDRDGVSSSTTLGRLIPPRKTGTT